VKLQETEMTEKGGWLGKGGFFPLFLLPSLLLPLLLTAAFAQTVYIYEDENGVTHFTDRKPETDREVAVQKAIADPQAMLEIRQTGPSDDPLWVFRNRTHGPLAVRVSFSEEVNVVSYPELPQIFVLPARVERELVSIGAFDERSSWRYRLQTEAVPGDPRAEHSPDRAYRPPFAPGQSFTIGQAFGGQFSHSEAASYYAVDIGMPVGTPIHAARAGVVMDFARWFHGAGDNLERYGPRANFVRILHDDGTMAIYAHLDYEGVRVHEGQRVRRGQLIGKSGNTGFSTGPHLHFAIQMNRDMALISVPFEFEDAERGAVTPSTGLELKAP
jgi:murein DD-endopeptidase MepM/ murein hydrolase activator NlpD